MNDAGVMTQQTDRPRAPALTMYYTV